MYFVAGVTGNTGNIVANTLLQRGQEVRVMVRNAKKGKAWEEKGAEVVVGELQDTATLSAALRGIKGAYLLTPPRMDATDYRDHQRSVSAALAEAVKASRVPRVTYLSSIAAHLPSGTGPVVATHDGERLLGATGAELVVLRAAYFMQNWGMVAQVVAQDSVVPSYVDANTELDMVSTEDIGEHAAELLLEARPPRLVELAGPRPYRNEDAAEAFGKALGKTVKAVVMPTNQVAPTIQAFGASPSVAGAFQELYEAINARVINWENPSSVRRGRVSLKQAIGQMVAR